MKVYEKVELLAPAGDFNCLKVAIENGADAVYIGSDKFNARVNSKNFEYDELEKAVDYAHLRKVKIYLTLNTLINNTEISEVFDIIKNIYEIGFDAVIVQDLGIASIIKENFPEIPLHASTQMTVYDLEGIRFLENIGFKRIVVSREVNVEALKKYINNTNVEIEVFAHGALCMSYSGQCLMSSFIGGRSGNRGRCAQPCRMEYELISSNKKVNTDGNYLLSMKDLCSISELSKFLEAGVSSIKIEGRMKSVEYVSTVIESYRNEIDKLTEKSNDSDVEESINKMASVFNRGGFTKGYISGEERNEIVFDKKPNNCGIDFGEVVKFFIKEELLEIKINSELAVNDVLECYDEKESLYKSFKVTKILKDKRKVGVAYKGENVLVNCRHSFKEGKKLNKVYDHRLMKKINSNLNNDTRKIDLECEFLLKKDKPVEMQIKYNNNIVKVVGTKIPEIAINKPLSKEKLISQLEKTGSTTFRFNKIDINMDDGLIIPISEINEIRRNALNQIENIVVAGFKRKEISLKQIVEPKNFTNDDLNKRKINQSVLFYRWNNNVKLENLNINRIYLPLEYFIEENIAKTKLIKDKKVEICVWIPPITKYKYWKLFNELINQYKSKEIIDGIMISNLGHYEKVKDFKLKLYGDYQLNILNDYSRNFFDKKGLEGITYSTELNFDQLESINSVCSKNEIKSEIIVYGRIPVMHNEYCIITKNGITCGENDVRIKDKIGVEFPVYCDKINCINTILNSKVLYIGDEFDIIKKIDIDNIRLIVTDEKETEIMQIIEHFNGINNEFNKDDKLFNNIRYKGLTKGHYMRGV